MTNLIVKLGMVLIGLVAIGYVVKPTITHFMPQIEALGTNWEIAIWGLLPVLLLFLLVPLAIRAYRRRQ